MDEKKTIVDGQLVTASAWSPSPARQTIVLLHGFPMDRQLWNEVGGRLGSSRRVLALDLPGFGGSGAGGSVLGMPETADWLASALAAFQIEAPVVLIGLSMGGYVAMEFAARHRDRLERLVLCSTKAEADSDAARKARIEMAEGVEHIGVAAIAERMLSKLLSRSTRSCPERVARFREMVERTAPSTIAAAQRGMACRRSMLDEIPRWRLPIACIAGEEDALTGPAVMQTIVHSASDGKLHVLPRVGHVAPLEAPEALSECILQSLEPG